MLWNDVLIIPEAIPTIYKETGIKPVRGTFYYVESDGKECGCLITAISAFFDIKRDDLPLSHDATLGTIDGWDLLRATNGHDVTLAYFYAARKALEIMGQENVPDMSGGWED